VSLIKIDENTYLVTDDVSAADRAAHKALASALEEADGHNTYEDMAWHLMRALSDRGHWIVKGDGV
jgi:hypothetical protein